MKPSDLNAPPVSAPDYGRSLRGLGFNLLVRDVPRAVKFATDVLGATAFYANDRFAAMKLNGADFMLHHDGTYKDNALYGIVQGAEARGIGVELRSMAPIPIWPKPMPRRAAGPCWPAASTSPTGSANA